MKDTTYKLDRYEVLFFSAYAVYFFFAILSTSLYAQYFTGSPYKYIKLACLGCLLVYEFLNNQMETTLRSVILLVICAFLVLISAKNSDVSLNHFSMTVLFLYFGRKISFKKIVLYSFLISVVALIFVIGSAYMGIISNYIYLRGKKGSVRYFLGFRWTLYASTFFFNIVVLFLYLIKEKYNIFHAMILSLISIYLYKMTDARMNFLFTMFVIWFFMIFKYLILHKSFGKIITIPLSMSFIICFIVSYITSAFYTDTIKPLTRINEILSQRLSLAYDSIQKYGITLLGQNIEWKGNGLLSDGNLSTQKYDYVDSWYIQYLQKYGVVVMVIMLIALTFVLWRCFEEHDNLIALILILFAVHAMIDDMIIYFHYNSFIFLISYLFVNKKKKPHEGERVYERQIN